MVVIGKAGATIKEIIEKFSVSIDLDRDSGNVKVSGENKQNVLDACEHIKSISNNATSRRDGHKKSIDFEKLYEVDEILTGKVVRIADFGAFIELPKGGEGLLHISKISKERVKKVEDVLKIDDNVEIKDLKVRKDRIELASSSL